RHGALPRRPGPGGAPLSPSRGDARGGAPSAPAVRSPVPPDEPQKLSDIPAALFDERRSRARRYVDLVVGERGWWALVRYELVLLLASWVPGAVGLFLRSHLYPRLLGACGKNVSFVLNLTLRHPRNIRIGDDVAIDDECVLDAKGTANQGIRIGRRVFIGRNTILACKDGDIVLEDEVNIPHNWAQLS